MSDSEMAVNKPPSTTAGGEGEGGAEGRPLTNKEKRQLAVAQKRAAKEQAAARKLAPSSSSSSSSSAAIGEKRKRDATSIGDVEADGEPVEGEPTEPQEDEAEVEVLSHKEQRRRKKLAKLSDSTDSTLPSDPNALMHPSRAPTVQPRSGFSIWVGNLSFFTAPAKLIDWFEQRGVDGISRVNMPKGARRAEMNRGFCYLDLPSKDMLTAALNLSEQPLDGRKLLIKNGSDFTGRPDINTSALGIARTLPSATTSMHANKDDDEDVEQEGNEGQADTDGKEQIKGKTGLTKTAQKILRAQKNPPSMTLFLGNLSFNTTEQGVRDLFDHSASKRNPVVKKTKKERKSKDKNVKSKAEKSSSSSDSDSDSDSSSSSSSSDSDSDLESDSDSDSDSDEEEKEKKTESQPKQTFIHPSHGEVVSSSAGIRKVRLGTFEDAPTKCKGFGFLDFHTVEQATCSLLDPRNTFLDGRKIILQYASADATRRGASKQQKSAIASKRPNELRVGFQRNKPKRIQPHSESPPPIPGSFNPNAELPKKHKETKQERLERRQRDASNPSTQKRSRPGAALANAQRASTAVVQSTGTKISFDD
ncbi:related to RNA-binding protein rnp24 [Ustilago trichophora]|uniref:Related to RNA-binding protein rnp24 n=1 Tax=Ustilago trichophora TaxID=86804 RepID=A0A5C3EM20_9BASI|nr:related to RNA-binding protein rnp24 [Ustilago trichophora]